MAEIKVVAIRVALNHTSRTLYPYARAHRVEEFLSIEAFVEWWNAHEEFHGNYVLSFTDDKESI